MSPSAFSIARLRIGVESKEVLHVGHSCFCSLGRHMEQIKCPSLHCHMGGSGMLKHIGQSQSSGHCFAGQEEEAPLSAFCFLDLTSPADVTDVPCRRVHDIAPSSKSPGDQGIVLRVRFGPKPRRASSPVVPGTATDRARHAGFEERKARARELLKPRSRKVEKFFYSYTMYLL